MLFFLGGGGGIDANPRPSRCTQTYGRLCPLARSLTQEEETKLPDFVTPDPQKEA